MHCPKCDHSQLKPVKESRLGLELDKCPDCLGIWFDDKELFTSLGIRAVNDLTIPKFATQQAVVVCPRCHSSLHEFCYPNTMVLIDACRECNGVWLDAHEWKAISQTRLKPQQMSCPKCNKEQPLSKECAYCGIIIDNYLRQIQSKAKEREALERVFSNATNFRVEQDIEWLEVISGFETKNKYSITITSLGKNILGYAYEQSNSLINLISKQLLSNFRPFSILFKDSDENYLLRLDRGFSLYFHKLDVGVFNGSKVGSIKRRFKLMRTLYEIEDRKGRLLLTINGPLTFWFLRFNWTFKIEKKGEQVGVITKKWKGVLREAFTDGDKFMAEFDHDLSLEEKLLIFGSTFLIDFVHFEDNQE